MEKKKTYKLCDIASVQTGPFGSQLHNEDYVDVGTPIVTVEHLGAKSFSVQNLPKVSQQDCARLSKYSLKEGDIVFSRVGSVDRCSYVSEAQNGWLFSGRCLRVRAGKLVYPEYLYYYFQKESVKQEIRNVAVGATMPSINTKLLSDLIVELPPFDHQIKVAKILASIDEKIQINNRINHNLEEQAQALYKSWFVDFEPFKDDKFVDSELGMIPEGWDILPLGQVVEYRKNTINPQRFPETEFIHYSLPAFDNSKEPEIQCGTEIMSNKFVVEDKMVLFSKLNPRIKRLWVLDNVPDNSVCSTEFIAYKGRNQALFPYIWCYLNGDSFYDGILSMVNGATGSHQRFHAEDTLGFIIPFNQGVAISFSKLISPILCSIMKNERENRSLKQERDALLPKMMNGTLHFGD